MKMHASTTNNSVGKAAVQYARHPNEDEAPEFDEQVDIAQTIQTGETSTARSKGKPTECYIHIPHGADLSDYLPVKIVGQNASAHSNSSFGSGQGSTSSSVGYSSSHSNASFGSRQGSTSGSVGYPSSHSNASFGSRQGSTSGSVGYPSSHSNASFGSRQGSTSGSVGYPSSHSNASSGSGQNTRYESGEYRSARRG
ncbi:hypothetical protein DFP73DRAFT_53156 [Morchella snyderi]|nr:hypothetical protein DFP73DRAFT_53156 [Morchella snyderi]